MFPGTLYGIIPVAGIRSGFIVTCLSVPFLVHKNPVLSKVSLILCILWQKCFLSDKLKGAIEENYSKEKLIFWETVFINLLYFTSFPV